LSETPLDQLGCCDYFKAGDMGSSGGKIMKHHAVIPRAVIPYVVIPALCALLLVSSPVFAQHAGHGSPPAAGASNPASKAFAEANARMHKAMSVPLTGNADADFARGMIPHHQGAVEMAEIILKFGKDHAIHGLASAIIKAQKTEIAFMSGWLARNTALPAQQDAVAIKAGFEAANTAMHKNMAVPASQDADKDFLRAMIPHHEGAVTMAKILQQYGKDAELQKLAADVIQSQTGEIAQMRDWLSRK
jgi:uncharacterized protein (DUF305 family)